VTAVAETATGLALAIAPATLAFMLLGASFDTPSESVVARVAGGALLSLGVACWLARDDASSRAGQGLVAAMLLYNVATVAVLAHARLGFGLTGVALWPAVGLHFALAVWCIACLRTNPNRSSTGETHR